jgi:hypothetical protein
MELKSEWQFVLREGGWLWRAVASDGTEIRPLLAFPTLDQCIDHARSNGYSAEIAEEHATAT